MAATATNAPLRPITLALRLEGLISPNIANDPGVKLDEANPCTTLDNNNISGLVAAAYPNRATELTTAPKIIGVLRPKKSISLPVIMFPKRLVAE